MFPCWQDFWIYLKHTSFYLLKEELINIVGSRRKTGRVSRKHNIFKKNIIISNGKNIFTTLFTTYFKNHFRHPISKLHQSSKFTALFTTYGYNSYYFVQVISFYNVKGYTLHWKGMEFFLNYYFFWLDWMWDTVTIFLSFWIV